MDNTVKYFEKMSWKEFEDFVIELFTKLYADVGVRIIKTPYQSDGGKDGYASLIINPYNDDTLSIAFKFWVEVKKRSRNVDHNDITGHIILAYDESVNKLIFVTNTAFTSRAKKLCKNVGNRLNVNIGFIDGKSLIKIQSMISLKSNHHRMNFPLSYNGQNEYHSLDSPNNSIHNISINSGFLHNKEDNIFNDDSALIVDIGEIFYWVCEVEGCAEAEDLFLKFKVARCDNSHLRAVPLTDINIIITAVECHQRIVFAVWGENAGNYKEVDLPILFDCSAEIKYSFKNNNDIIIRESTLSRKVPASRQLVINEIKADFEKAIATGGIYCQFIEAAGGIGKSYILERLRQVWLTRNLKEIRLDGSIHKNVREVVRGIIIQGFPFPENAIHLINKDILLKWFKQGSLDDRESKKIINELDNILSGIQTSLSENDLALIIGRIIIAMAATGPVVLLFEDLHKVNSAVINLISELLGFLYIKKKGTAFILLTSRPYADNPDRDSRSRWREALQKLYGDSRIVYKKLSSLPENEAIDLLISSVKHLKFYEAAQIIRQVGANPFFLKETLLYLRAIGVIESHENIALMIANPSNLRREIKNETLKHATRSRIYHLNEIYGNPFGDFLLAAACYGDSFSTAICRSALNMSNEDSLWEILNACEKYDLFRPVVYADPNNQIDYKFDHDLVRSTILENVAVGKIASTASLLLKNIDNIKDMPTKLKLSYLSSHTEICLKMAEKMYLNSYDSQTHYEALLYCLLKLYILQLGHPMLSKSIFLRSYIILLDESFKYITPAPMRHKDYPFKLEITLTIIKALEELASIGTMEEELTTRLVSLGHLNAEIIRDELAHAKLYYFYGLFLFGQNKYNEALECFIKASEIFKALSAIKDDHATKNEIRISICQRHLGQLNQSMQTMKNAFRMRRKADWILMDEIVANIGAFNMYSNLSETRRYWQKGEKISRRINNWKRVAHFINDLAHLDIMEGNYDNALNRLSQAEALSLEHSIHKEYIRSCLFKGCIYLVLNKLDIADCVLNEIEEIAISKGNLRRLWRIRANLATMYEAMNKMEDAYIEDRRALIHMPIMGELKQFSVETIRYTRVTAALANIIFRYRRAPDIYKDVSSIVGSDGWNFASKIIWQSDDGSINLSSNIGGLESLYKPIGIGKFHRFLITE